MKTYFVDSNIFLRFILEDDKKAAQACEKLFQRAEKEKIVLKTNSLVIAEIIWVLLSFYELNKLDVIEKVRKMIEPEWLKIENKCTLLQALILFERENVDFIDAFNFIWAREGNFDGVISFDKDFDKLDKNIRKEP